MRPSSTAVAASAASRRAVLAAIAPLAAALALHACTSRSDPAGSAGGAVGRARRIRLPDVTLHTLEVGPAPRAPAVRLVVHGGPGLDHTYLRPWLDRLATPRARVVYVDLRGQGRSDSPA